MRTQDIAVMAFVGCCLLVVIAVVVTFLVRGVLDFIEIVRGDRAISKQRLDRVQPMSSDWQWPSHLDHRDIA